MQDYNILGMPSHGGSLYTGSAKHVNMGILNRPSFFF